MNFCMHFLPRFLSAYLARVRPLFFQREQENFGCKKTNKYCSVCSYKKLVPGQGIIQDSKNAIEYPSVLFDARNWHRFSPLGVSTLISWSRRMNIRWKPHSALCSSTQWIFFVKSISRKFREIDWKEVGIKIHGTTLD